MGFHASFLGINIYLVQVCFEGSGVERTSGFATFDLKEDLVAFGGYGQFR